MIQDISSGRLENEYRKCPVIPEAVMLCIRGQEILIRRDDQGHIRLPRFREAEKWFGQWKHWGGESCQYAFRMLDENYFLWMGDAGDCPDDRFFFLNARRFRELDSKDACFGAMTGWHLYQWYRSSRFCGRCGSQTVHDEKERMMRCPECGNMIFPRISPAVITAVTDGDRLLLSKYAGRGYSHYALIAGFAEIGETLEQTVRREVMEEVGLTVKNIRYYKSQPWGVDGNLLAGFFCDLEGSDMIRLDEAELSLAQWHHRNALPAEDDGISLTREMIRVFGEGREPR